MDLNSSLSITGPPPGIYRTVISTITPDSLSNAGTPPPPYSSSVSIAHTNDDSGTSDSLSNLLSDASSSETILPFPSANRLVFEDSTSLKSRHPEPSTSAYLPRSQPRNIVLRDYRQIPIVDRIPFLLENLALICFCIRSTRVLTQVSGPPTTREAKHSAKHVDSHIVFNDARSSSHTYHLGDHRLHFHAPIQAYDQYERRLQWLCTIPTCVSNLLPFKLESHQLNSKQALLTDSLDDLVLALQANMTCRQMMNFVRSIEPSSNSIILNEIGNKYSLLHLVVTEAFNDARFPARLRKPRRLSL